MDAFLSKNKIEDKLLPSIGIIALTFSSKLNEIFYIGINPEFFIDMKDNLFLENFPQLEKIMLSSLNYNINIITPFHFINLFNEMKIVVNDIDLRNYNLNLDIFKILLNKILFIKIL